MNLCQPVTSYQSIISSESCRPKSGPRADYKSRILAVLKHTLHQKHVRGHVL